MTEQNLINECINLYHKKELENERLELIEANKFVIKAQQILNEALNKEDSRFNSSSVYVDYTSKMLIVQKLSYQCTIQIDDFKFVVRRASIRLLMTCSKCNEEYESEEVACKADIGYLLEFSELDPPNTVHTCKSQSQQKSAGERLEELIIEIASGY